MSEFQQTNNEDNIEEIKPGHRDSPRTSLIWFVSIFVVILFLIIVVSFGFKESADQMNFLTVNILSFFALAVVISSAITANKQWEVMRNQEIEMTNQRRIMYGQLEVANKQINLMMRSECAYISIGAWEIPEPVDHHLVIHGKFFNGGRTPAFNFRRQFQIATGEGIPPPEWGIGEWERPTENAPASMIVAGGDTGFSTKPLKLSPANEIAITCGKQVILLDGECIYTDSLDDQWIYKFGYTLNATWDVAVERYQTHEKFKSKQNQIKIP